MGGSGVLVPVLCQYKRTTAYSWDSWDNQAQQTLPDPNPTTQHDTVQHRLQGDAVLADVAPRVLLRRARQKSQTDHMGPNMGSSSPDFDIQDARTTVNN